MASQRNDGYDWSGDVICRMTASFRLTRVGLYESFDSGKSGLRCFHDDLNASHEFYRVWSCKYLPMFSIRLGQNIDLFDLRDLPRVYVGGSGSARIDTRLFSSPLVANSPNRLKQEQVVAIGAV